MPRAPGSGKLVNMKKLLFALTLATAAHGLYWGRRYLSTPADQRSWLILLGPLRAPVRK